MTLIMGCDYSDPAIPARVLVDHGAKFACRYASTPGNPKNLTAHEVEQLGAAGIGIVSVFETTAQRALAGFSAGIDDAHAAFAQHEALGKPLGRPIYFAADWDVTPSELVPVSAYFEGLGDGREGNVIGVYGGLHVCDHLLGEDLVDFVWQTYAWSHGLWAAKTHIRQIANGLNWSGYQVDQDQALVADFGQWSAGSAPIPTPTPQPSNWTDAMIKNMPTIQNGEHDPVSGQPFIHRCQALINVGGVSQGIAVDGVFGPHTEQAVRTFQQDTHLAVDGIVGPHTWGMLVAGQSS